MGTHMNKLNINSCFFALFQDHVLFEKSVGRRILVLRLWCTLEMAAMVKVAGSRGLRMDLIPLQLAKALLRIEL